MTASAESQPFSHLAGHQYISLVTFRKDGTPVPTPVWFAQVGDRLYVTTDADSGKVKRLRNNPQVTVAPCTVRGDLLGEAVPAVGRLVQDTTIQQVAELALRRKYRLIYQLFIGFGWVSRLFSRSARRQRAYLVIESS